MIRQTACKKCNNDIFKIDYDTVNGQRIAVCENCLTSIPYHSRKPKANSITVSQERAVDRIKNYFLDNSTCDELETFEIETTEYGTLWVNVITKGNIFIRQGGHFSIGPKGGIKIWSVYVTSNLEKITKKLYALGLHATIRKI